MRRLRTRHRAHADPAARGGCGGGELRDRTRQRAVRPLARAAAGHRPCGAGRRLPGHRDRAWGDAHRGGGHRPCAARGRGARVRRAQAPLHHGRGLRCTAGRARHVPRAVSGRELGAARLGRAGALRCGGPLLPRRVVRAAAPSRRHEHAHRAGHRRGLRVLARGDNGARAGGRPAYRGYRDRAAGCLLRGGGNNRHPRPPRTAARIAGTGAHLGRDSTIDPAAAARGTHHP